MLHPASREQSRCGAVHRTVESLEKKQTRVRILSLEKTTDKKSSKLLQNLEVRENVKSYLDIKVASKLRPTDVASVVLDTSMCGFVFRQISCEQ